jgi:copper(I)-binding protein
MNRVLGAILIGSCLTLTACGGASDEAVEIAPEGVPGMNVENGRLVLPPVAGNPAAVYFDLTYDGERALTIRRADVAGAESAMLHDYGEYDGKVQMMEALPIGITKGDKLKFEPGNKHVMAFGLPEGIEPGSSIEVTLTVSGGDKYTFDATVQSAGDER